MEEPGLWWAWSPVCLQEQTEQPLSMVSPALAGRVGPGPGADGSSAGLGRDFELGVAGQELPQKLVSASALGFVLGLSGRCTERGGSLGAEPSSPVKCLRKPREDAGREPVRMSRRQQCDHPLGSAGGLGRERLRRPQRSQETKRESQTDRQTDRQDASPWVIHSAPFCLAGRPHGLGGWLLPEGGPFLGGLFPPDPTGWLGGAEPCWLS